MNKTANKELRLRRWAAPALSSLYGLEQGVYKFATCTSFSIIS